MSKRLIFSVSVVLLWFLAGCTPSNKGGSAPTDPGPIVKIVIDGGGQVLYAGQVCKQSQSPCLYPAQVGATLEFSVFPTNDIAFYSWSNCSAPNGTKCVHTVAGSSTILAHFGPVISLTLNAPRNPSLVLSDPITLSKLFARQRSVAAAIGSDPTVTKWCVSHEQSDRPYNGVSKCMSPIATSHVDSNGWSSSPPGLLNLSSGDGQKVVFVWVANAANDVNLQAVSASIVLDTVLPAAPTVQLSDLITGSQTSTSAALVKLKVTDDARANSWCLKEQNKLSVIPQSPLFNDACWSQNRPTQVTLAALGPRSALVFIKSISENVSIAPGIGNINFISASPALSLDAPSAFEGNSLIFNLSLSVTSLLDTTVNYSTNEVTAVVGTNYSATSGTVTIPAGQLSTWIMVPTIDDKIKTAPKLLSLRLSGATNANIATESAIGTIFDVDAGPVISIESTSISEGQALSFKITQSAAAALDTTFRFSTQDGTAKSAVNYRPTSGTYTIPAGQLSTVIKVPTIDDFVYSPNLTVLATISAPTTATLGASQALGIVNDIDQVPTLTVSPAAAQQSQPLTFNIKLAAATGFDTTFSFATSDASAIDGTDYVAKSGSVTIPKGQVSATFNVSTLDSQIFAPDKELKINITQPTHALLASAQVSGLVKNIHSAPSISIISTSVVKGKPLIFTVLQAKQSGYDTTFTYSTSDGTAVAGINYTITSLVGTIPAGSQSTTLSVPTIDDGVYAPPKTLSLTLSSPSHSVLGSSVAKGSILSSGGPSLSVSDSSANEGSDLIFNVSLASPALSDIHVDYASSDVTAKAATNYSPITGSILIPTGSTSAQIVVHTLRDGQFSLTKTMRLYLVGSLEAPIARPYGVGSISNQDEMPLVSMANASKISGADTTFNYRTQDGSAMASVNYVVTTAATTIPAGQKSISVHVPTLNNGFSGPNVSMKLGISNIVNAAANAATADGLITNNYGVPIVSIANASSVEGSSLSFVVALSSLSAVDVTVTATTSDGSAVANKNYVGNTQTVTIPAGKPSAIFAVTTLDAQVLQPDLQMITNLSGPNNALLGSYNAIGNILNNHGVPYLSLPQQVSTPEGQPLQFTIKQSAVSDSATSVSYVTFDLIATAPKSYSAVSGTATIPAGQTSVVVLVPTVHDGLYNVDQTMSLKLSNAVNANLLTGASNSIGIMVNTDPVPTISIADASAVEGQPLTFTATLSSPSAITSTFSYETVPGSALPNINYTNQKGSASIPAGSTAFQIQVPTLDDLTFTPSNKLTLKAAGTAFVQIPIPDALGTISNADLPPTLSISDSSGNEGTALTFKIIQDNISGFDTTFNYTTSDGSGVDGRDYSSASGSLTIKAGETSASVDIQTIDQGVFAAEKNFNVALSSPSFSTLKKSIATGLISNDHSAPLLSISSPEVEEGGILDFQITQSVVSGLDTTFDFSTSDGTAVSGVNYLAQSGTAKIPAGSKISHIRIQTSRDNVNTNSLTLKLLLANAVNANLVSTSATGTIDNIDGTPNLSVGLAQANEGSDIQFLVTSSNLSASDVTFSYSTLDGTAKSNINYSPASGTATIVKGTTTTNIIVHTLRDNRYALAKTMKLQISNPANANISGPFGVGTINNIDPMPVVSVTSASTIDGQPLVFIATQSAISEVDSVVGFETFNGTAFYPANFAYTKDTFTIPAGQISTSFAFVTYPFFSYGHNVGMSLTLSSPINSTLFTTAVSGEIVNHFPPPGSSLTLADAKTGNTSLTNNAVIGVSVGENSLAAKWCLGSSPLAKPASGGDACLGSAGGNNLQNGWLITKPTTYTLSGLGGLKSVYLWIADQEGKVSDTVSAQITLDTAVPATPIVILSDSLTGSTSLTNKANVNLSISGDTGSPTVAAWCVVERDHALSATALAQPNYNDPRWTASRPTSAALGAVGARDVYVFTKSLAQNISQFGVGSISYSAQPPADPTLTLQDPVTNLTSFARQSSANVSIGNDSTAIKYCLSELQSTRPVSGTLACQGGVGDSLGWSSAKPSTVALSAGDGNKKLFLWIVDSSDNANLNPGQATITVDTVLPTTGLVNLQDPNTQSLSFTNQSSVNFLITNDLKATSWLVTELAGSAGASSAPLFNDPRWTSNRPSSLSLTQVGARKAVMWTMSAAKNVSAPIFSSQIDYQTTSPVSPSFTLLDSATSSLSDYTSTANVLVSVAQSQTAARWCLSEIQTTAPSLGSSFCLGGISSDLTGWTTSPPTTFAVSAGDGLKTLFLWVADRYNNVSAQTVTNQITLNTTAPPAPVIALADLNTGSSTQTNQNTIGISITSDSTATGWCVFDQDAAASPPVAAPGFNSPCWQSARMSQVTLTNVGTRAVYVYVRNNAKVPSKTYASATIDNSNQPPSNPTLGLSDPATLSSVYVRQNITAVTIGSLSVNKWCLSETQNTAPASGTAICRGGAGSANGWYTSIPATVPLSASDGLKRLYIWVANSHNNVSTGNVSATITVDTSVPVTPTIVVTDPTTRSTTFINSTTPQLTITGDTASPAAIGWCSIEQDSTYTVPNRPNFDSSCWKTVRPTSITMSTFGIRTVFVFTKSTSQNVSAAAQTTFTYSPAPPADPFFSLVNVSPQSSQYANNTSVIVAINSDSAALKWCLSESQSTRPANGSSTCNGGAGSALGWLTARPTTMNLSPGDGQKRVYLWIADSYDDTDVNGASYSIILNTVVPNSPTISIQDPNTLSATITNRRISNLSITSTGAAAVAYCVYEFPAGTSIGSGPTASTCSGIGWVTTPPTSVTLGAYGNRAVAVYSKSISGLLSLPGNGQISFIQNGPSAPSLALADPTTGNTTYARQQAIRTTITNDAGVTAWCLSETQVLPPASFTADCSAGQGTTRGWFTSRPTGFSLSAGNDVSKIVYLWVADASGNVNNGFAGPVSSSIYLETTVPTPPVNFTVKDSVTGSSSTATHSIVNLNYAMPTDSNYVCLIELPSSASAPATPSYDDPCFKSYPTVSQAQLQGQGQRQFYLFARTFALTVGPNPAVASIFANVAAPTLPSSFTISAQSTGSTTVTRTHLINTSVASTSGIVKWCVSESQVSKPTSGTSACPGGAGTSNGWFLNSSPTSFTLSAGDGLKTVYLWVADSFDNVSLTSLSASITMQTPVIPTTPIISLRENGSATTNPVINPSNLVIQNDANATKWCVVEQLQVSGIPNTPPSSNACWVSIRPTSLVLAHPHQPTYVAVWIATTTGDVSPTVSISINFNQAPPPAPVLSLFDPTTGSTTTSSKLDVGVTISSDTNAAMWCLSQTQATQPVSGTSVCQGGSGSYNGWFTERPSYIHLTGGSGNKTVYLWIADQWNYTSTSSVAASIQYSPSTVQTPVIVVADTTTLSQTSTASGQIKITITNAGVGDQWCAFDQAHGSGNPTAPNQADSCWVSAQPLFVNLVNQGSRDIFVFAKDQTGTVSSSGSASIQFNTQSNLLTSNSVANGAISPVATPTFAVSNSVNYYRVKNANRALDCPSDADSANPYSVAQPNSGNIIDNIIGSLDGDVYLCLNVISDPAATPNYALSQYFHWVKEASWGEKAFLKGPTLTNGVTFGDQLAIWKNYLVVADTHSKAKSFNGQVYVYSIGTNNTVSLVNNFGGTVFVSGSGTGAGLATNADGLLAVQYATFDNNNDTQSTAIYDLTSISSSTTSPKYLVNFPKSSPGFSSVSNATNFGDIAFDPANPGLLAVSYTNASGGPDSFGNPIVRNIGGVALYKYNAVSDAWPMDSWYTTSETAAGDLSIGTSIAMYNGTIIAGAPGRATKIANGTAVTGAIYLWTKPSDSAGKIYSNPTLLQGSFDTSRGHEIGYKVAFYHDRLLNRNYILAGDPLDNSNAANSGAVYYWSQDALGGYSLGPTKLFSQNSKVLSAGAKFGSQIKTAGNHIVISAPGTSAANTAMTVWNFEGTFVEKASLSSSISQYSGVGYGTAVAVSPQYILIGSPADTTSNPVSTGVLITPPSGADGVDVGGVSVFNGYN
jgi:hypothetical protein